MSGFHLNEEYIREALHTAACSCNPPEDLKQKIDARLAWQEKKEGISMKKNHIKKTVVAAALACVLTGTVCMAAEKFSGYYIGTSTPFTEVTDYADIEKLEKKTKIHLNAPERFDNGFTFDNANISTTSKADAQGNAVGDSFQEIMLTYQNGEESLTYTVSEKESEYTKDELARMQDIEADGVTYHFSQSDYLFVPAGYEPTAEETKAQEAGELFISEGTDAREEKVYKSISWNADGQGHILFGADLDMNAEELLEMAKQVN